MAWLGRWSNAVRIAAVGAAFSGPGCFVDQPSAIDRICPDGEETCPCRDGQECNPGLTCMEDNRCRDPRCIDGRSGCACIDGAGCDPGLECRDKSCLLPDDGESTSSSGAAESTPPMSEPPMTSTPVSESDSTPETTIDPSMTMSDTFPLTDGGSEVGPSTFGESGMASDTMTMPFCQCGWRSDLAYYACGQTVEPADPDGAYPPACPDGTKDLYNGMMGGEVVIACESVSPPIGVVGCCLDATLNVWCEDGLLVFGVCDDTNAWCFI